MSGNFVQRGQPAIMDKYTRTKMALSCGADLVLELPCFFCIIICRIFCKGAISILDSCSVIDTLCYGVENNEHGLIGKSLPFFMMNPGFFLISSKIYEIRHELPLLPAQNHFCTFYVDMTLYVNLRFQKSFLLQTISLRSNTKSTA